VQQNAQALPQVLPDIRPLQVCFLAFHYDLQDDVHGLSTPMRSFRPSDFFNLNLGGLLPDAGVSKPGLKVTKRLFIHCQLSSLSTNPAIIQCETTSDEHEALLHINRQGQISYKATPSEDHDAWEGVYLKTIHAQVHDLEGAMARIDALKEKWEQDWFRHVEELSADD
jgi:hypothetical protein